MASTKFSMLGGWLGNGTKTQVHNHRRVAFVKAQVEETEQLNTSTNTQKEEEDQEEKQKKMKQPTQPRPVEKQINVKSKNITKEYGGQWLSSVTRHVRIYAAYIDPDTWEMDQTQMDKLTLLLDTTNEFVWTDESCHKVFCYFQELADHYEGAPLTKYTLRLIGSDLEHYIRKLLYDGEIKYNMNSNVLNFSMGKPRILYNDDTQLQDGI